MNNITDNTRKS